MRYMKMLRIFSVVIILALLIIALPAAPVLAVREVVLDPNEGKVGDEVTVTGTGFNKSTDEDDKYATLYFSSDEADTTDDIDDEVTHYEKIRTGIWLDEEGAFKYTFKVPAELTDGADTVQVVPGTYYVYVCHYGYKRIAGYAEFTVVGGSITIDPDEGPVGTEIEITGSEFSGDESIAIEYDGDDIDIEDGDDETDSDGEFT